MDRYISRRAKTGFAARRSRIESLERRALLTVDLVISEFMAANDTILEDEDRDHSDWIEIYNPTAGTVDLSGWHLTGNAADLDRWTFPAVNLPAGERLVVFASNKDRAVAGSELHTNFKLNGDGEYLALVRPDLSIASQFTPAYPDQVPDVSYGIGIEVTTSPAVTTGAAASVHVPADGNLGTSWTGVGFDDSTWNATLVRDLPSLVIAEAGPGEPDFVEIQNVLSDAVDTSGWVVAVSASAPGNPSATNGTLWSLPATVAAGALLYRTDNPVDNYWGSDIAWSPGGDGWVMIVDDDGRVVDFTAWGYSQSELASLNLTVNGHLIGGTIPLVPLDYEYEGNPAIAHPISGQYPDLTGTLLTNGNLGTTDWRSGYAGSQEPNSQGNSGRLQPRVTFDLGGLSSVRTVTITYMVDQSAGIYAPDQVTISFGSGGLGGSFSGGVVSTGFDDSSDGLPATFFGAVRTLMVDVGGASANAVRLDFLNDREWTFLSEVSFTASSADVGWHGDGAASDATPGASLQRQGSADHGNLADFAWQAASAGVVNAGLSTTFPVPPIVTGVGYDEAGGFEGAFATDLAAAMQGTSASVYVRVPFEVTENDVYAARLRMKYDGGFVAYINGQEVARRHAPAAPVWNSAATAGRQAADALVFETIDLPLSTPLPVGQNVLAIHGLNDGPNSTNFLLVPELDVAQPTGAGEINVFFSTPTPGAANSLGLPAIAAAPVYSQASGVYSAGFNLSLSTPDPLGQIRYTLDGSEPTAGASLYTTPLIISATALVKARAFRDGQIPSPIRQGSYLLIDPALTTRDSNVPLLVLDSMSVGIPSGDAQAALVAALIDTDATGRAHITDAPDFLGRGGMRVRGSSSQAWPKKNYSFETWDTTASDVDVSVFGFPSESDWVLYASYLDRTLLRDALVFDLSNQMGNYAVRTRPVEVYLNTGGGTISESDYLGVYIFMERIKQGDDRVDVAELEPSDSSEPDISGGYILKIDRGTATIPAVLSRDFVPVDPEDAELTPEQRTWLTNYIAQFESALSGPDFSDPTEGYAKYIDVASWIDYHIMTELTYNVDEWYLSTYLSKDRGGKLTLGPFWDFDRSLGNTTQIGGAGTTGFYSEAITNFFAAFNGQPAEQVVEYPWFRRLFQDPNFYQTYVDRFQELRRTVLSEANIFATIDQLSGERLEAQVRNYAQWNTLNTIIAPSPHAFPTYEQHVANLKTWIHGRLSWLDGQYVTAPELSPPGGVVAPGTQVSLLVPGVPTLADTTLIGESATIRSLVPTGNSLGTSWTGSSEPFNDSTWTAGQNGVGYESDSGYESYIHVNVPVGTPSSFVRATFNVADLADVDQLILKLRFDDGFVAYVNGARVAGVNAPETLAYDSIATGLHDDASAVVYQDFDITAAGVPALQVGTNVLAIHGLNYLTSSTDYLLQFQLIGREELPTAPQPIPVYYTTDGTDPRVPFGVTNQQILIGTGQAAKARVPTSDIGTTWRNLTGFDDSTWASGPTGVGFEKSPGDPVNYTSLIGLDIRSQIDPIAGGANEYKGVYVRIPFTVSDADSISTLFLKMKYDDAFVAYLNGTKIAESRAPAAPLWNSQSVSPNPDTSAVEFEQFDVSQHRGLLQDGNNLLAIHGMGTSLLDSDMLILPQLEAVETVGGIAASAVLYSGPLMIGANTRVIARSYDGTRWSGPTEGIFTVAPSPLRITELQYHPGNRTPAEIAAGFTNDDDFEYLELMNTSATASVDLSGVQLVDGVNLTLAGGTLDPGERGVLVRNQAAFEFRYGGGIQILGQYGGTPDDYRLSNSGEQVTLLDAVGGVIQSFSYLDSWYSVTDGGGPSLTIVDPLQATALWDQPSGWRASFVAHGTPGADDPPPATVVGRHIYYNHSAWDGNGAAANAADDGAIAPDKTALLPGGTGSLANYTSFSKGITGIMIDVMSPAGAVTVADFAFKTGNSNSTASWTPLAVAPTVAVRTGAGAAGSDRISLTWPEGTIRKTWLQVTMLAGATTGLAANDVFYFGNAIGEAGDTTSNALVNATDEIQARANPRNIVNPAPITFLYDYNRDKLVNATDQIVARSNTTNVVTALRLIVPAPAAGPEPGALADAALVEAADDAIEALARRRRR